MLSLHLLQNCLIYVNTLMIQRVLDEPDWSGRLTPTDLRALTPLFYAHINPYGTFELDNARAPPMSARPALRRPSRASRSLPAVPLGLPLPSPPRVAPASPPASSPSPYHV